MIPQVLKFNNKSLALSYSKKYNISEDILTEKTAIEIRELNYNELSLINSVSVGLPFYYKENQQDFSFLLIGNQKIFLDLIKSLYNILSKNDLIKIEDAIKSYFEYPKKTITIKNKSFKNNSVYLFGIVNVTPDSFSDGGKYFNTDLAIEQGIRLFDYGFDIIDIGGESTKPGVDPVSLQDELERVIPVIKGIIKKRPDAIISIDTYKSVVAEESIKAGASIVNDISGLSFDDKMAEVISKYNVAAVLMHIKGTPKNMQQNPIYDFMLTDIYNSLYISAKKLKDLGCKNIIIDPGIGFGKTPAGNVEIIREIENIKSIGCPILIGLSRKSLLKNYYNIEEDKKDFATSVLETISVMNGARFIRTHNPENGIIIKKMLNSVINNV